MKLKRGTAIECKTWEEAKAIKNLLGIKEDRYINEDQFDYLRNMISYYGISSSIRLYDKWQVYNETIIQASTILNKQTI